MSYTPTIYISKEDLEKNRSKITEGYYESCNPKGKVSFVKKADLYEYLFMCLDYAPLIFKGIEITIIEPEFTTFNKSIRIMLDKLEIYYKIYN